MLNAPLSSHPSVSSLLTGDRDDVSPVTYLTASGFEFIVSITKAPSDINRTFEAQSGMDGIVLPQDASPDCFSASIKMRFPTISH